MGISKMHQSGDWDFVEPNTTFVTEKLKPLKAVRIDQDGAVNFTPEGETTKPAGNYVQGEILDIQGVLTITCDATARVQVFY